MRTRVILALDKTLPDEMRFDVAESLEEAGWIPVDEDNTMWKCGSSNAEIDQIEKRIRKAIEFAAFTAGVEGRVNFVLKVGTQAPQTFGVRIGSGGAKTKPVAPRFGGSEFSTEKVPAVAPMPSNTECPDGTQLRTAF